MALAHPTAAESMELVYFSASRDEAAAGGRGETPETNVFNAEPASGRFRFTRRSVLVFCGLQEEGGHLRRLGKQRCVSFLLLL